MFLFRYVFLYLPNFYYMTTDKKMYINTNLHKIHQVCILAIMWLQSGQRWWLITELSFGQNVPWKIQYNQSGTKTSNLLHDQ